MADIALLVVEEYERRKRRDEEQMVGIGGVVSSYISSLSRRVVGAMEMEGFRKPVAPKSPLALAAFEGFFPA
ncbi:unnamed protein product [Spirodela intermedia]|uniref:Uncharacterized protein n=1 Tax=Spirodela intermedia TaxID=51605 RepID=A0A7I8IP70_SPIIN|nr:unnamed protein product [Spirodela intermedia]CAA6658800.1 unnamed protein product [Spirodela intermedia]